MIQNKSLHTEIQEKGKTRDKVRSPQDCMDIITQVMSDPSICQYDIPAAQLLETPEMEGGGKREEREDA